MQMHTYTQRTTYNDNKDEHNKHTYREIDPIENVK